MPRSYAVATAHPEATAAAAELLESGGSAVDGAIAAQAVIAVLMPHAAGIGGDVLALCRAPDGELIGVNGTGRSPRALDPHVFGTSGHRPGMSVTVPGLVAGWADLHERYGRLSLPRVLAPAIRSARDGFVVDGSLARSLAAQRDRLVATSPDGPLATLRHGDRWVQPELAETLEQVAHHGRAALHAGDLAAAVTAAVTRAGGWLDTVDLASHATEHAEPLRVSWDAGEVAVQPPHSQGVLLAMALAWLDRDDRWAHPRLAHLLVELTEAVFAHRDDCAAGMALLRRPLDVDLDRAARRGGPRPYLHTAGVAVATGDGDVVSSLVSVFDDFGSCVWVPEGGFVLNNRADGFTAGNNAPAPHARPVHTLAPAMVTGAGGQVTALATPGADGQVQSLLQVLASRRRDGLGLDDAIGAPRWRSHDSSLVIEPGHPDLPLLRAAGHRVVIGASGDDLFGSVVAAGVDGPEAHASADWRRGSAAITHHPRRP